MQCTKIVIHMIHRLLMNSDQRNPSQISGVIIPGQQRTKEKIIPGSSLLTLQYLSIYLCYILSANKHALNGIDLYLDYPL